MSDKRLIDANKITRLLETNKSNVNPLDYNTRATYAECITMVNAMETIDAVPVVRCMECRNSQKLKRCADQVYCTVWKNNPRTDGYCYLGAKMDGGAADGSD